MLEKIKKLKAKVAKPKVLIILLILSLFFILAYTAVYYYNLSKTLKHAHTGIMEYLTNCQNNLNALRTLDPTAVKTEEYWHCQSESSDKDTEITKLRNTFQEMLTRRDRIISISAIQPPIDQAYSGQTTGFSIPFAEGQKGTVYNYYFRGNLISSHVIALTNNNLVLTLWEFNPPSNIEGTNIPDDFAIITGYENYSGTPTYVTDLVKNKNSYKNRNGLTGYWGQIVLPHEWGGLIYYQYKQNVSSSRYFLLEMSKMGNKNDEDKLRNELITYIDQLK